MKKIFIVIITLILFSGAAYANSYRLDGVYEISTSNDWRVMPNTQAAELMKQAEEIAKESKVDLLVDLKNINTPFMIYKEQNNGFLLVRIMVLPPELTKEEFDDLTPLEYDKLSEWILKRQNDAAKSTKIRMISSKSGIGKLKGIPAIKTESISFNSKGFKVSRAQYTIYRSSSTIIISMEHTVQNGEPNYKIIEDEISRFNVLAQ